MRAIRHDSPLRFRVPSRSRKGMEHVVELDTYDGNGSCFCEHFQNRLEKHLQKGARAPGDELRCHHIREARAELADNIIKRLIERRDEEEKQTRKDAKSRRANNARHKDRA